MAARFFPWPFLFAKSEEEEGKGKLQPLQPLFFTLYFACLILGWFFLFRSTYTWLAKTFFQDLNLLHLFILAGLALLSLRKSSWLTWFTPSSGIRDQGSKLEVKYGPSVRGDLRNEEELLKGEIPFFPYLIFSISILAHIFWARGLSFHFPATLLAITAGYSLLGFLLPVKMWKRGWAIILLAGFLLTSGHHLDTYLGFPLRLYTTQVLERFFQDFHLPAISQDTILILENQVSQVDLPCSGLKGLSCGLLFFWATVTVEEVPLNFRTYFSLLIFIFFLFAFNMLRMGILVGLTHLGRRPDLATALHVPLGVIGFGAACAGGYGVLKWIGCSGRVSSRARRAWRSPEWTRGIPHFVRNDTHFRRKLRFLFHFFPLLLLLVGLLLPVPHLAKARPVSFQSFSTPMMEAWEVLGLSPKEESFFQTQGLRALTKRKFEWQGKHGSLLVVIADSFRAHHDPVLCLAGGGLHIQSLKTQLIAPGFPIRHVRLSDPERVATFWFQSPQKITEDFSARVWDELWNGEGPWALVSVVWDEKENEQDEKFLEFHRSLKGEIQGMLK